MSMSLCLILTNFFVSFPISDIKHTISDLITLLYIFLWPIQFIFFSWQYKKLVDSFIHSKATGRFFRIPASEIFKLIGFVFFDQHTITTKQQSWSCKSFMCIYFASRGISLTSVRAEGFSLISFQVETRHDLLHQIICNTVHPLVSLR